MVWVVLWAVNRCAEGPDMDREVGHAANSIFAIEARQGKVIYPQISQIYADYGTRHGGSPFQGLLRNLRKSV